MSAELTAYMAKVTSQLGDKIRDVTLTIASGQTESNAFDTTGLALIGFEKPETTGTSFTFTTSSDGTAAFVPVVDGEGNTYTRTAPATAAFVICQPSDTVGMQYIKLVSNSAEASDRTFKLALKPL